MIPTIQEKLAKDLSDLVRGELAYNPALIEKLQYQLLGDQSQAIREYLTINPSLIEDIQLKIVEQEHPQMYTYLASNSSLKLKPALLLYFSKNNKVVRALKADNFILYTKIAKLEKGTLRQKALLLFNWPIQHTKKRLSKNYF